MLKYPRRPLARRRRARPTKPKNRVSTPHRATFTPPAGDPLTVAPLSHPRTSLPRASHLLLADLAGEVMRQPVRQRRLRSRPPYGQMRVAVPLRTSAATIRAVVLRKPAWVRRPPSGAAPVVPRAHLALGDRRNALHRPWLKGWYGCYLAGPLPRRRVPESRQQCLSATLIAARGFGYRLSSG